MFRFRLDIAGEIQMDRGIARFADGIGDYRPIWLIIEDDFYAQEKDQFKTEGEEGGERWAPLSGASWEEVGAQGRDAQGRFTNKSRVIHGGYAAWKEAHYPGMPILQRTGALFASLTSPNDANTVRIEERKTLTLGSRVPYAIYHQSPEPRKRLPRRPEIMLTETFKRGVMHHVQTYLVQMASQLGFRKGMGPIEASKLGSIFGYGGSPRGASPRRSSEGGWLF